MYKHRIRIQDFFADYDKLRRGRISQSQARPSVIVTSRRSTATVSSSSAARSSAARPAPPSVASCSNPSPPLPHDRRLTRRVSSRLVSPARRAPSLDQFAAALSVAGFNFNARSYAALASAYPSSDAVFSVAYKAFCDDVNAVFTKKLLERTPLEDVDKEPSELLDPLRFSVRRGGETAPRTTPFAWCTPFLKDFSRRHSSPALPFQRLTC